MERVTGISIPLLTTFAGLAFSIKGYYLYGGFLLLAGIFLLIVRFRRRKRINGKYF
jgi:hypothetical protein